MVNRDATTTDQRHFEFRFLQMNEIGEEKSRESLQSNHENICGTIYD